MAEKQVDLKSSADSWCYTSVKVARFTYLWKINDFIYRCADDFAPRSMQSPEFTGPDDSFRWRLWLHPCGGGSFEDQRFVEYLSVSLLLLSNPKKLLQLMLKFSILDSNNKAIYTKGTEEGCKVSKEFGFREFIQRKKILDSSEGLLPGGNHSILQSWNPLG